jgi:site-specific recombinase XerD
MNLVIPRIEILKANQPVFDLPFFTANKDFPKNKPKNQPKKPISREHLTRQVNFVLKQYSQNENKFIRSHSARVSMITDTYNMTKDILLAKNLVGHKNIKSTELYIQNSLSEIKKYFKKII